LKKNQKTLNMKLRLLTLIFALLASNALYPCTNYLVTKGASTDGSTMISYAADSHVRYGELYFRKGGIWPEGSMVKLYDRGSNRLMGQIPQARQTYNVIGFMNENQVCIGETTFGGLHQLEDTTGTIDYGSLMFLAMDRAKTAREAIKIMGELVEKYGYYGGGESFSIADPNEVWIMEIVGKGTEMVLDKKTKSLVNKNKGAVWVAIRIPDGCISAHANQARITTFTLENGKTSISSKNLNKINIPTIEVVYAYDVIQAARDKKLFTGKDSEFSFSDTYAPMTFDAARFSEIRVWSMFKEVKSGMNDYLDYVSGKNLKHRMPLYIKPDRKLTPADLMHFKRDHLEGTPFDMTKDAGAGSFGLPYRWRPLTWKYNGKEYLNERATATQQTGFSYIAQMRSWLPNPIGGINWFGVDDASSTVYVPFYCGITAIPHSYAEGNGDMLTYSEDAAFWSFNKVANFCYLRYNLMIEDVKKLQSKLEGTFAQEITNSDQKAMELWKTNPENARKYLNEITEDRANSTVASWNKLFEYLLVKYIDGNIKREENGQFKRNAYGFPVGPMQPGYNDTWKKQVIESNGDVLLVK
jgi:dipeptidase